MSLLVLSFSKQALEQALQILASGGIVAHATETCYGFACDLANPQAVQRLFALKKRPADQPVSALFSSLDEAKKFVVWNEQAEELARKYLPGPLTLILPLRSDAPIRVFPTPLTAYRLPLAASLGVRISSNPLAQELAKRFGKPLSTTSANLHGQKNTYSTAEIIEQCKGQEVQPDLIIDSGKLRTIPPSTVMDLTEKQKLKTLRRGII